MPFTPKLTYKGKPLVRKDNELYYGCMTDPYVLYLQIQSTKTVGGVDVADKVHLQLLSTDESKPREARVARQTTKNGLYNALDIGLYKERLREINDALSAIALEKGCTFLNLWEALADENGDLIEEYAQPDGYHLLPAGYDAWVDYLCTHT